MATRGEGPASIGELSSSLLGSVAELSDGSVRAGYAWNRVVNEAGRRHTQGLYLERRQDGTSVLHVYLDSSPLIQDYQTDHLLYERRLAEVGLTVSSVRFELSRQASVWGAVATEVGASAPVSARKVADPLPPLDEESRARVSAAGAGLSDGLDEAFRSAMEASLRRDAAERAAGRTGLGH